LQPENLLITKTAGGYLTLTLAEHYNRSVKLASALSKWGVKFGDRVATLMWNSSWHMQCYHAISCMGAVLHTLNLRLGPADLGWIINHAHDRVIFSDADLLALLAKCAPDKLACVELYLACGEDGVQGAWTCPSELPSNKMQDFDAFLDTGDLGFVWPDIPETSTHALCYTSGTTGNPKGVAYSQRSTYLHTLASSGVDQLGISGSHVILPFVPMFHVLSWGVPFVSLMLGNQVVFTGRFMDPGTLVSGFIDWSVDFSTGVPTVWQGVRAQIEKHGVEAAKKSMCLQTLTCGGSAPPVEMMLWYYENLSVDFIQGWGMTETNPLGSVGKRCIKLKDRHKTMSELNGNISKAGIPLPGVQVRIADPDNLDTEMLRGQAGELLVRGPWITGEYFHTNAADKFHKGWLITGDVAKIDDEGAIIISDRSKDVIKSGGEWISSIDLENHISSMSEIAMAAVVAMPHPKWDERPIAVVVLTADAPAGAMSGLVEKVRDHCSKAFAKFQLPDDVLVWDAIPLTGTGKLDKKLIRQRLQESGYNIPSVSAPQSKL